MRFEYPSNLFFSCSKCGICCGDTKQKKRHILLLKSDVERIAVHTRQQINTFAEETAGLQPYVFEMRKNSKDGKCIFLQKNECNIYEVRPLICRFYPFELSTSQEKVYKFKVTDECPGIFSLSTKGVKKLDSRFFRALLELACAEFDAASP